MARRWEATFLVLATGASLAATIPGFLTAILSPVVFSPQSNLMNPAAWLAFILMVSFWMVCIAAPYGAWVAFHRKLPTFTWLAMSAPLVWAVAMAASLMFINH